MLPSAAFHPSTALLLAGVAYVAWRWAPAGAERTDRIVIRTIAAALIAVGALILVAPIHAEWPLLFAIAGFVGLWLYAEMGLPGLRLSSEIASDWKSQRLKETIGILGLVFVVAVIWQKSGYSVPN